MRLTVSRCVLAVWLLGLGGLTGAEETAPASVDEGRLPSSWAMTLGEIPEGHPDRGTIVGIYVVSVEPGGLADQSGLRSGDIIVKAMGSSGLVTVGTVEEFSQLIRERDGRPIAVQFVSPGGPSGVKTRVLRMQPAE